jgi:hypothetical protein
MKNTKRMWKRGRDGDERAHKNRQGRGNNLYLSNNLSLSSLSNGLRNKRKNNSNSSLYMPPS